MTISRIVLVIAGISRGIRVLKVSRSGEVSPSSGVVILLGGAGFFGTKDTPVFGATDDPSVVRIVAVQLGSPVEPSVGDSVLRDEEPGHFEPRRPDYSIPGGLYPHRAQPGLLLQRGVDLIDGLPRQENELD